LPRNARNRIGRGLVLPAKTFHHTGMIEQMGITQKGWRGNSISARARSVSRMRSTTFCLGCTPSLTQIG